MCLSFDTPPNLFAPICRILLHQSIENNNVELKNEAKCI